MSSLIRLARRRTALSLALSAAAAALPASSDAQVVRFASGIGAAAITPARDQFRVDLGGGAVAGANGSFGGVRREINWDGVPDAFAAPNSLTANFFNANSPRGVVFSTLGTGFQVSSTAVSGVPVDFGNINPAYTTVFDAFSAERLFTAIGSNVVDVNFFVPGTSTSALTRGFGAIFSDVDLANTTSIQFFDGANVSLGTFVVPNVANATAPSFSFLGVSFATAVVGRVRITSGNAALGPGINDVNGNPTDLVVMDDFLYGEPTIAAVPEPTTVLLVGGGLVALAAVGRRRRTAAA